MAPADRSQPSPESGPHATAGPRAEYEHLQASVVVLLPASDPEEIMRLTAGRPEAPIDDVDRTPWITYADIADSMTAGNSLSRSNPVRFGHHSCTTSGFGQIDFHGAHAPR